MSTGVTRKATLCSREAGDIVRLVARRRLRGDGEGRRHHVVPAGAGRGARRLRPLLVLALQRGGGLRQGARAQRYVLTSCPSVFYTSIHRSS